MVAGARSRARAPARGSWPCPGVRVGRRLPKARPGPRCAPPRAGCWPPAAASREPRHCGRGARLPSRAGAARQSRPRGPWPKASTRVTYRARARAPPARGAHPPRRRPAAAALAATSSSARAEEATWPEAPSRPRPAARRSPRPGERPTTRELRAGWCSARPLVAPGRPRRRVPLPSPPRGRRRSGYAWPAPPRCGRAPARARPAPARAPPRRRSDRLGPAPGSGRGAPRAPRGRPAATRAKGRGAETHAHADLPERARAERGSSRQQRVQRRAQPPDVRAGVDRYTAAHLLGSHVEGRADRAAGLHRGRPAPGVLGDAEIEHLDERRPVGPAGEEQVPGLDVAMDHPPGVRLGQGLDRLQEVLRRERDEGGPSLPEDAGQVAAREVLHDQE